jgi:hypothetical protein
MKNMAFVSQSPSGKFVAWGKKKAKENSLVVEAEDNLTGEVVKIKDSPKYGKIIELNVKGEKDPVIVLGTTILNRQLGYKRKDKSWVEDKSAKFIVGEGDKIRITFLGMIKSSNGNDTYNFEIEVDR